MSKSDRSSFQQEVVAHLIETKAIDFDAIGKTLSHFGKRAALEGESIVSIIDKRVMLNCGWPVDFFQSPQIQRDVIK